MAACLSMLLPHPAVSSPAPAPAASANIIHHEGGAEVGRNPANSLVALVNANRTAARLPPLRNSKGLGCMALQYVSHCITAATDDACDDTGVLAASCHPPETDLTEVYAANCGVELPTVDLISGRLLGCSSDDALPLLGANASATAAVVRGKEHTQVGAGFLRQRRHGPYLWCLLFSSGSPSSTFRLEAAGRGIAQTQGCFSDPDNTLSCSAAGRLVTSMASQAALLLLLFLAAL
ncbi:uncharacterized protein LOC124664997 [Lolium rigidum]|uniref:uncharacterized protein LOC124664997 n=1 Tax=Lolium rigidum TaxID=89674 RepID=UPI001F5C319F|nr:uncharacterized protein LOC124664997 [Lolium rigidum]